MSLIARLILGASVGLAVGACFNAPRPAVQFSCDAETAPQCPPDYACEADGCCHLVGSDVEAHEGECQLAGGLPTEGDPTEGTPTGTAATESSGPTSTDSGAASSSGGSDTSGGTTAGSSGDNSTDSGTTDGSSG